LLLPLCLILSTGCSEPHVRPSGCQVDLGLIQKLSFPERPNDDVTNGWLVETLKDLRLKTEADNARKDELLRQLEVCNQ
jgi:hypothetical protein